MTPEEWQKVRPILESALELDCANRPAFLNKACADPSLRLEIESLIDAHEQADTRVLNSLPVSGSGIAIEGTDDAMIGRHLGVYELARRIGQGGMAAVFLAYRADGEFHRQVAIKLVLPGLDSNEVVNRFRKERQTLAGLDHPNIVKLLDGGSTPEGLPYLVLDYVEGSPIDEYCDSHKLSIEQRLRLFDKVCEALQHAHQKLVIHRDLKPSNILVTADGIPKLLDFGIAKVLEPAGRLWALTQTGARCMTPGYASPEQVRGKSATIATDIYSLGVVLYELLTGHRPYRLKEYTASEIERAICEQEPETPSTAINRVETDRSPDGKTITKTPEMVSLTREGQPEKLRRLLEGDLDNIVLKALQKEPEHRYGSVAEFSQDIDRHLQHQAVKARPSTFAYRVSKFVQRHKTEVSAAFAVVVVTFAAALLAFNLARMRDRRGTGSSQTKIRSLAVLPLVNISGDLTQEYFSDGLTDALIGDLAEIGSLKIISRTSSMQYKQTKKTLPEIAQELDVDGIIEGTVQRSGDHVRITANLIQAATDKHLWTRSYERDVSDFFMLEREVAGDIAHQIQTRLAAQEQAPASSAHPGNLKALEAYLQGNYHLSGYGEGGGDEEKKQAAEYFRQAIDADPNFSLAYVGLAKAHWSVNWPSKQDAEIVTRATQRALALDPNSSGAHDLLGQIKQGAWEFPSAEEEFQRAIALNPSNAQAHDDLGGIFDEFGRWDEGWKEQQIAQELDPSRAYLAVALENRRQIDRAITMREILVKRFPDNGYLHVALFRDYLNKGMYDEAQSHAERLWTLFGFPQVSSEGHKAFVASGFNGALRVGANEMEHLIATNQIYLPMNLAELYVALGDKDRAFYWLEQSYSQHEIGMFSTDVPLDALNTQYMLDPLRSDPRFKDLLRRVGLPELQLNDAIPSSQQNGQN